MWFRRKQPEPSEAVHELRRRALTVSAPDLGLSPVGQRPHVWGVVMETGYPQAVATLVAFADGTTSLYFSNGGGVIGAGGHAVVRQAGEALLSAAEAQIHDFAEVHDTPVPGVGRVRFYVRTFQGLMGAEADENELGEGRHTLSPVFHAAHWVISAVRESTPQQP